MQAEAARDGVACEAAADEDDTLDRSLRTEGALETACNSAPPDAPDTTREYDYSSHPLRAPPARIEEVFPSIRTAA